MTNSSLTGVQLFYTNGSNHISDYDQSEKRKSKKSDSPLYHGTSQYDMNQSTNLEEVVINSDAVRRDNTQYQPAAEACEKPATAANDIPVRVNEQVIMELYIEVKSISERLDKVFEAHEQRKKAEAPAPWTISSTIKGVAGGILKSMKWFAYSSIPAYMLQVHHAAHLHAKTAEETMSIAYSDRYWAILVNQLYDDGLTLKMFAGAYLNPLKLLPQDFSLISNFVSTKLVLNKVFFWINGEANGALETVGGVVNAVGNSTLTYGNSLLQSGKQYTDVVITPISAYSTHLYEFAIVPILELNPTTKVVITALIVSPTAMIIWKKMRSENKVLEEPDLEYGNV